MEEYEFLDRLRENLTPEVEGDEESRQQLREFAQWLLIVPLVMLILFGCGQLAIFTTSEAALADTQSRLSAEYGLWPYVQVKGLRVEIIEEIKKDGEESQIPDDTYSDPIKVADPWVDSEVPPIVVAQLPGAGTPSPTGNPSSGSPDPGQNPTATLVGTATPTASRTPSPWPTATFEPTSTDNPSATRTFTPTPSLTPSRTPTLPPTQPGAPTWTPSPTASRTPIPSNTPTNAPVPPTSTNTPIPPPATDTPPPPPPDYCSNIKVTGGGASDWQGDGVIIKFDLFFKNDNTIPAYLTSYSVSWTTSNGLGLNRAKTNVSGGSNYKLLGSHGSSPASGCEDCPVQYNAGSSGNEIYQEFCRDIPCDMGNPSNNPPLVSGSYNFSASGTLTLYGSSTVYCNISRSGSVNIP